jgi:hypothetical protein
MEEEYGRSVSTGELAAGDGGAQPLDERNSGVALRRCIVEPLLERAIRGGEITGGSPPGRKLLSGNLPGINPTYRFDVCSYYCDALDVYLTES